MICSTMHAGGGKVGRARTEAGKGTKKAIFHGVRLVSLSQLH